VVPPPPPAPPAPAAGQPGEERAADVDEAAPTIRVLGPVEVTGIGSTGHGPALAALACLLHFKPARDPATLTQALSPTAPWTTATLNKRISELRNKLGAAPDGELYVPRRRAADPYHLSPAIRSDWQTFQNLAHRGLAADDTADLEAALGLVRGRPFAGRDFPWALPLQQQMISRIVDVAHTVAVRRAAAGTPTDLEAARSAIATGLEVEPTIERLYRDWMRIEHAAEHRAGVYTAIGALQDALRVYDLDMQPETDQLITKLLGPQSLTIR
jgi:DNA-binding SARP family transcriptional activator